MRNFWIRKKLQRNINKFLQSYIGKTINSDDVAEFFSEIVRNWLFDRREEEINWELSYLMIGRILNSIAVKLDS